MSSCCAGKCKCGTNCGCGSGCNGCGMYPDVEATAAATTMVIVGATNKASSGGFEAAAEGCGCGTCKCATSCGCSCCCN
ncbi:hypothetical protein ACP70R_032124 [Stipagrostis hirtigluma subsp. patula]